MPQRTFTSDDITGFNLEINQDPGNSVDWSVSGSAFNNISGGVSHSDTASADDDITISSIVEVTATGSFNFQSFPAVPLGSIITNVKLRFSGAVSGFAHAEQDNPGSQSVHIESFITGNPYNFITVNEDEATTSPDIIAELTGGDSLTLDSSEIEISGLSLSYDDFVLTYQDVNFFFRGAPNASASSFSPSNKSVSFTGNFSLTGLELIVTYDDPIGYWEIENDEIPVKVGSPIKIVNVNGPGNLGDVIAITFTYGDTVCTVNQIDFLYQSPDEIQIYAPFCLGSYEGEVSVAAVGNGTSFSGSVGLGALTVFFEDASGIYRIVKGKTTDTKYNPERDGTTSEIKIPNPFGATGFVDG